MKQNCIVFYISIVGILGCLASCTQKDNTSHSTESAISENADSLLRHIVLFKFNDAASPSDIETIEKAFHGLPGKIQQIHSYEWGINNSPEGLAKGFTHCFLLTFKSENDRTIYLPHPDHKAFGELLGPHLEDVLVVDYWAD